MGPFLTIMLYVAIAAVLIIGLFLSLSIRSKQKNIPEQEGAEVRHPVLGNPYYWMIAAFLFISLVLIYYFAVYYGEY